MLTCEICNTTSSEVVNHVVGSGIKISFCPPCLHKEMQGEAELKVMKKLETAKPVIKPAIKSDTDLLGLPAITTEPSLVIRSDYFNVASQSLAEMKKVIDADDSIPADKKDYEWARRSIAWHKEMQDVLLETKKIQEEAISTQKAIQVNLNQMANKLREEERAALRIEDIKYPATTTDKKVKKPSVAKPKGYDRIELAKIAEQYGVDKTLLQLTYTANKSKGMSLADCAQSLVAALADSSKGGK